ncbi:MAG: hypothetical protein GXY50_06010 [Syntrophomonadaceae bacterium]|nr:hypothetical protein [Syntrophomonadaceae bacterium]
MKRKVLSLLLSVCEVIDLSSFNAPEDNKAYTFAMGSNKTITLKSNGAEIQNVAFVFGTNNNITIENLNIKTADNHVDCDDSNKKGYSPLHFTGLGNNLTLVGENTLTSGQTSNTKDYGAAVGVPFGAGLTITAASTTDVLTAIGGACSTGIGGGNFRASGTITINGGTVTVEGSRVT